ncbi:uncharacterized protein LTR77_006098 [Saxophila tyrrhenica]|uniref:RING-type domain-containing protein n=1 Tax=Saxophila tyrrhenica TaxID=1690608 RepID=A0AAV9PAF1_9PEZI|nr:hypothetical protein LTR77_006098 [Saxophila tyrrhenica]
MITTWILDRAINRVLLPENSNLPAQQAGCRICHQLVVGPVRTPCGCLFCNSCVREHLKRQARCPQHVRNLLWPGLEAAVHATAWIGQLHLYEFLTFGGISYILSTYWPDSLWTWRCLLLYGIRLYIPGLWLFCVLVAIDVVAAVEARGWVQEAWIIAERGRTARPWALAGLLGLNNIMLGVAAGLWTKMRYEAGSAMIAAFSIQYFFGELLANSARQ